MRLGVAVVACFLSVAGLSVADNARASIRKSTNIPAESLAPALKQLAHDRGFQLVFESEIVGSAQTQGAVGEFTPAEALKQLLKGTGLSYRYLDEKTITIIPLSLSAIGVGEGASVQVSSAPPNSNNSQDGLWADFLVAQSNPGPSSGASAAAQQAAQPTTQSNQIQEVIVTAQKRAENLMDVPAAVTAISGQNLETLRVDSLSDLAGYVPGLTVTDRGAPGFRSVTIRGLSTGAVSDGSAPLVGTYVDDVPIGSSTNFAAGNYFGLDLLPYDIERVEVLEGPQGTLYGANTMGGLIKYALRKPDLNDFEARAGGLLQSVSESGSPDWGLRGAINLPLVAGSLGLRLSAFDQTNAGYIDNIGTGQNDANHSTQRGGRAALLWKPSEDFYAEATLLYQDVNADDVAIVPLDPQTREPLYGPQTNKSFFPQPFTQQTRSYFLHLDWNLHFADLSSTSAWSKLESQFSEDLTIPFGVFVPGHPDALDVWTLSDDLSKFVEELRLTSPGDQRLQWLLGGFFTREYGGQGSSWPTYTPAYVPLPTNFYIEYGASDVYREVAGFGDLTYKLTSNFDVTAGGRYSSYRQDNCPGFTGGLFGTNSYGQCLSLSPQGVTTWMGTATYHLNKDAMLYARVSTGYRPGQPVVPSPLVPIAPSIVRPDKTTNYELGFKGSALDQRLQITLSAFDVHWRDIQVSALYNNLGYQTNAGTARSTGAEMSALFQAADGLRFTSTLTYTDARLTQDALGIGGRDGDQLPVAPRWTATVSADYSHQLTGSLSILFGGGYRYRDMIVTEFSGASTDGTLPIRPWNILDLHAGLDLRQLQVRLYALNVFNDRSYSGLQYLGDPTAPRFTPILPRTLGISADYRF